MGLRSLRTHVVPERGNVDAGGLRKLRARQLERCHGGAQELLLVELRRRSRCAKEIFDRCPCEFWHGTAALRRSRQSVILQRPRFDSRLQRQRVPVDAERCLCGL